MEGLRLKREDGGKKTAGNVVIDILRETESGKSGIAEILGCLFLIELGGDGKGKMQHLYK